MMINTNKNTFTKKTYTIFVISLKTSNKKMHFLFFHVIILYIMFSDELENKLFFKIQEKNFMMHLCFLNINNNYKNYIFFNLISKI